MPTLEPGAWMYCADMLGFSSFSGAATAATHRAAPRRCGTGAGASGGGWGERRRVAAGGGGHLEAPLPGCIGSCYTALGRWWVEGPSLAQPCNLGSQRHLPTCCCRAAAGCARRAVCCCREARRACTGAAAATVRVQVCCCMVAACGVPAGRLSV